MFARSKENHRPCKEEKFREGVRPVIGVEPRIEECSHKSVHWLHRVHNHAHKAGEHRDECHEEYELLFEGKSKKRDSRRSFLWSSLLSQQDPQRNESKPSCLEEFIQTIVHGLGEKVAPKSPEEKAKKECEWQALFLLLLPGTSPLPIDHLENTENTNSKQQPSALQCLSSFPEDRKREEEKYCAFTEMIQRTETHAEDTTKGEHSMVEW